MRELFTVWRCAPHKAYNNAYGKVECGMYPVASGEESW